jgi:hypothetical protein
MARRTISHTVWLEIKTRWQNGAKVSDLAKIFGVDKGTISAKSKAENWQKIQQQIEKIKKENNNLANSNAVIQQNITNIQQYITPDQIPLIISIINEQKNLQFNLMGLLKNGVTGISKMMSDAEEFEADKRSIIYRNLGVTIESIAKASGLSTPENQTNVQINNNTQPTITTDDPIAAARAYQELMQGE